MEIVNVDLPIPRGETTRENPAFFQAETRVRELLRQAERH